MILVCLVKLNQTLPVSYLIPSSFRVTKWYLGVIVILRYPWNPLASSILDAEGSECFHIFVSNVGKREAVSTLQQAIKSCILQSINLVTLFQLSYLSRSIWIDKKMNKNLWNRQLTTCIMIIRHMFSRASLEWLS